MKLHEYQAKDILRANGVKVPPGIAASTTADAVSAAKELGGDFWVVKAQVHAGGRGKGRFKEIDSAEILDRVVRGEASVAVAVEGPEPGEKARVARWDPAAHCPVAARDPRTQHLLRQPCPSTVIAMPRQAR